MKQIILLNSTDIIVIRRATQKINQYLRCACNGQTTLVKPDCIKVNLAMICFLVIDVGVYNLPEVLIRNRKLPFKLSLYKIKKNIGRNRFKSHIVDKTNPTLQFDSKYPCKRSSLFAPTTKFY